MSPIHHQYLEKQNSKKNMQIIRATKSTRRYSKCNVCWTKMDTMVKSKVYWQIEGSAV